MYIVLPEEKQKIQEGDDIVTGPTAIDLIPNGMGHASHCVQTIVLLGMFYRDVMLHRICTQMRNVLSIV